MSWDFLYIVRRTYHGDDNWGDMYMTTLDGKWECLSYSYELAWNPDESGKSKNKISRIKIGTYNLAVRNDGLTREAGGKGWRLELLNTGHRHNIQIHRAARNLYIEGCILPVHFNTLQGNSIKRGDPRITLKSVELMDKIQERHESLQNKNKQRGNPSLNISAKLPAKTVTNRSHAHA